MTTVELTADCQAAYARRGFSDAETVAWAAAGINARIARYLADAGLPAPNDDVHVAISALTSRGLETRLADGESIHQIAAPYHRARKAAATRKAAAMEETAERRPIRGADIDTAWQTTRRVYVRSAYASELSNRLRSLGARWDTEAKALWVGVRKLDGVEALLASLEQERADRDQRARDEKEQQQRQQQQEMLNQVAAGKTLFTRDRRRDRWMIVGPAGDLVVGNTVVVTRSDGDTQTVRVTAVGVEREVQQVAYRTAEFKPVTVRAIRPQPVYEVVDRQAARVAGIMGLPTPSPSGRCHYCGLPLKRNGACAECV